MDTQEKTEILNLTTKIVTAYATKNPVGIAELPDLITGVCHGLATVEEQVAPKLKPAVPIKRSVTRAHVTCLEDGTKFKMIKRHLRIAHQTLCLEDGTKFKMIKRHLRIAHQMTPKAYREKWGLAADYPMTAPDYAAVRSKLAKKIGLGKQARGGSQKDKT